MNSIKRKIRDKRGVSLMLTMILLLFCLLVGGTLLAAASSNANTLQSIKEEQQAYLSVMSAVKLIRKSFIGTECTASITTNSSNPENHIPDWDEMKYNDDRLKFFLYKSTIAIYFGSVETVTDTLTISSESIGAEYDVTCIVTIGKENEKYYIHAAFDCAGLYRTTLDLKVEPNISSSTVDIGSGETKTTEKFTLIWTNPIISKAE